MKIFSVSQEEFEKLPSREQKALVEDLIRYWASLLHPLTKRTSSDDKPKSP
jgi:hypothetical protein